MLQCIGRNKKGKKFEWFEIGKKVENHPHECYEKDLPVFKARLPRPDPS